MAVGLGLGAQAAAAGQTGPACAPATLDNSALGDGSVTISPLPGSRDASTQTQISFLGVRASELQRGQRRRVAERRSQRARGGLPSEIGGHAEGASFLPSRPFTEGERVTVRVQLRTGGSVRTLTDQFAIAHEDQISSTPEAIHPGGPAEVQGFHSRPDLRPPAVTVTAVSAAVAPGDEFVGAIRRAGPGRADDPRTERQPGVVQAAPNVRLGDQPAGPGIRGQSRCCTWWQGDISRPRVRPWRGHNRRQHVHRHRPRQGRQRTASGPARVSAHPAGHGSDHCLSTRSSATSPRWAAPPTGPSRTASSKRSTSRQVW